MKKKDKQKFFDKKDKVREYDVFNIINAMVFFATLTLFIIAFVSKTIEMFNSADKTGFAIPLVMRGLAIIFTILPSLVKVIFKYSVTKFTTICYYAFLLLSLYLGSFVGLYEKIFLWDIAVHFLSCVGIGFLAMYIVSLYEKSKNVKLSPFIVAVIVLACAVSVGCFWEIYEFIFDSILGLNMQRFATQTGVLYVGQGALIDTMTDIIADVGGAILSAIICYICVKNYAGYSACFKITNNKKQKVGETEGIEEIEE